MAINLTQAWDRHAFPDDHLERDVRWTEEAAEHREDVRRELYLELSGADLRLARYVNKDRDDGPQGRSAKDRARSDMMLLAVGSPAYIAAYDNRLSFTIDGDEIEITQGELHDRAKKHGEDLQRQIEAAKRRGASAAELDALNDQLRRTTFVAETSDPRRGVMNEDDHRAVQDALRETPELMQTTTVEARFGRDPGNEKTKAGDMSGSIDHDGVTMTALTRLSDPADRRSVASQIDPLTDPLAAPMSPLMSQMSPSAVFARVAPPEPPAQTAPSENAPSQSVPGGNTSPETTSTENTPAETTGGPDLLQQNTGFNLG